jgi:hypothetical protein
MQITKSGINDQEKRIQTNLNLFFERFDIPKILSKSNISKIRGIKVRDIILRITELAFRGQNFYQGIVNNQDIGFNKSVAYGLLNNSKYNWRLFLYKVVVAVLSTFFKQLTSEQREDVLIFDDTTHPRNRSKRVELLARVYDHVAHKYFKGFRILSLCWSDGNSLLPVDFALLSSNNQENRYQEMNEKIDKRSCGYQRRKEAISKSTDLIAPMIKRALKAGIRAKHLLMDSWYGFPSIIVSVKPMIDVICMVKNMKTVFYYQSGVAYTLSQLYKQLKKKRGRATIKGSQIVEIKSGDITIQVKIVFVKNRNNKRDWLAILTTDMALSDEDVVRIYGKRWDIEVFFKMMKQCLHLNGEVELRSYDGMVAHISIVMLRFIFLTVEQRKASDDKTFGGIFRDTIQEMKDITIFEALNRILILTFEKIRGLECISKEVVDQIMGVFMGIVIENYHLKRSAA